jgi:hypothetical protein
LSDHLGAAGTITASGGLCALARFVSVCVESTERDAVTNCAPAHYLSRRQCLTEAVSLGLSRTIDSKHMVAFASMKQQEKTVLYNDADSHSRFTKFHQNKEKIEFVGCIVNQAR